MKKVLIVDDSLYMRKVIRMMLERNGFDIVGEAEDGEIAVSKYKELKPDIVTMDITMPGSGGLLAVEKINGFDPEANIVMITAMGQERLIRQAFLAGAKEFIIKPFNEETLVRLLKKVS